MVSAAYAYAPRRGPEEWRVDTWLCGCAAVWPSLSLCSRSRVG